jgi:hypothetical protein
MLARVDLQPLFDLEEEYDRALIKLSDAAREAVRAATVEAPRQAINSKRFQDQTGLLTSMMKGWVEISVPGGAIGEIGAYTYYASYVDGGTKPHEIHATAGGGFNGPLREGQSRSGRGTHSGGLLTFKIGGRWVSTPMVHHPGTKAYGMGGVMYHAAERIMIREIEMGVEDMKRLLGD